MPASDNTNSLAYVSNAELAPVTDAMLFNTYCRVIMLKKIFLSWASDVYFQGVAVNDVPFPGETAAGLDVPGVIFNGTQRHVLWDLGRRHAVLHVLLVGEDQHGRFAQVLERKDGWTWNKKKQKKRKVRTAYLVGQHPVEFLFGDDQTLSIGAVHHQDDKLHKPPATSQGSWRKA